MRNLFSGYYKLDNYEEYNKKATIILDTNILLGLYQYDSKTRDEIFETLEKNTKRIWIPYHVAFEFHNKRLEVLTEQLVSVKQTLDTLDKNYEEIKKCATLINEKEKVFSTLFQNKQKPFNIKPLDINSAITSTKQKFEELIKKMLNGEDVILTRITTLLEGKVGEPYSKDNLKKWCAEAKIRFEAKIPPGYRDTSKKSQFIFDGEAYDSKYSDYIIWKQIIEHMQKSEKSKDVAFISGERSEDWIKETNGFTWGPRQELCHEIQRECGVTHFWIYSVTNFYKHFGGQDTETAKLLEKYASKIEKHKQPLLIEKFDNMAFIEHHNKINSSKEEQIENVMRNYLVHRLLDLSDKNSDNNSFLHWGLPAKKPRQTGSFPCIQCDHTISYAFFDEVSRSICTCDECSAKYSLEYREADKSVTVIKIEPKIG